MDAERTDAQSNRLTVGFRDLLESIGEDPTREGLIETPSRWEKAIRELTSGVNVDPQSLMTTTFDAEGYDEVVAVCGIQFVSLCEHHVLPFTGHVDVAYLPSERIVGLSKIPRVVHCLSHRLQVQERLTFQICEALTSALNPRGVAVRVSGHHSCMALRGIRTSGTMITNKLTGVFMNDHSARAEVLTLFERS